MILPRYPCVERNALRPAVLLPVVVAACILLSRTASGHEGWGIVVDGKQQIVFTDIPTNTIWKVTREGVVEAVARKHSHALVLGVDDSIYGTQEHHANGAGNVWRIAPDGSFSEIFAPAADFPANLHPFTMDREGSIYSTNSISFPQQRDQVAILKSTSEGAVTLLAGGARGHRDGKGSEAQFTGIDGMAWAADGSLYVTDGAYVRRVRMDGDVITLAPGALTTPSWGEDLMGLTVSPTGAVYVADYSRRRLVKLSADGDIQPILHSGLIWSPTGVTTAGEDVYVLEHLRMPLVILGNLRVGPYVRVRKIAEGGAVSTIATLWGTRTWVSIPLVMTIVALCLGVRTLRSRAARTMAA